MYNTAVTFLDRTANVFGARIAIEDSHTLISYNQLQQMALSVATGILQVANRQSAPIVVYLPKSHEAVVSFMGILYSGNPYVSLDDKMPEQRLSKILENLNPMLMITNQSNREKLLAMGVEASSLLIYDEAVKTLPDRELVDKKLHAVIDTSPAYIMYTSGSTGIPKGVVIPHRGVIDYADWVVNTFQIDENSILGNQSPFYFDNSILDIYSCLATGAKLILIPDVLFQFPNKLPEFLHEKQINTIFWVPTVMINVANSGALEDGQALPHLKKVLFCGEVMPNKQLNIWRKNIPQALYANLYGPTEITDVCTYYIVDREFSDADPLPIGIPCRNTDVLVITEENKLAKTNELGELCVLGSSLALGYWHSPENTEKAFVNNPLNQNYPERMYKTGDLVYWSEDGILICVGRKDSQIKHKGNRIELGEIEVAVKSLAHIENACVLYDQTAQQIVLFVETSIGLEKTKINRQLMGLVPKYMLPGRIEILEKLPYNANGKIDRPKVKEML